MIYVRCIVRCQCASSSCRVTFQQITVQGHFSKGKFAFPQHNVVFKNLPQVRTLGLRDPRKTHYIHWVLKALAFAVLPTVAVPSVEMGSEMWFVMRMSPGSSTSNLPPLGGDAIMPRRTNMRIPSRCRYVIVVSWRRKRYPPYHGSGANSAGPGEGEHGEGPPPRRDLFEVAGEIRQAIAGNRGLINLVKKLSVDSRLVEVLRADLVVDATWAGVQGNKRKVTQFFVTLERYDLRNVSSSVNIPEWIDNAMAGVPAVSWLVLTSLLASLSSLPPPLSSKKLS